jgi:hypothetical protein
MPNENSKTIAAITAAAVILTGGAAVVVDNVTQKIEKDKIIIEYKMERDSSAVKIERMETEMQAKIIKDTLGTPLDTIPAYVQPIYGSFFNPGDTLLTNGNPIEIVATDKVTGQAMCVATFYPRAGCSICLKADFHDQSKKADTAVVEE